jgi:anhydro-N-acetylmuramic acid kinase
MDNTYVSEVFIPILERYDIEVKDKLRTCVELIAWSIEKAISLHSGNIGKDVKLIVSGGGAHNTFLIQQINKNLSWVELIIPDRQFIDFKEALMMAFLGYLRVNNRINILSSATGAIKDSIGGAVYLV